MSRLSLVTFWSKRKELLVFYGVAIRCIWRTGVRRCESVAMFALDFLNASSVPNTGALWKVQLFVSVSGGGLTKQFLPRSFQCRSGSSQIFVRRVVIKQPRRYSKALVDRASHFIECVY